MERSAARDSSSFFFRYEEIALTRIRIQTRAEKELFLHDKCLLPIDGIIVQYRNQSEKIVFIILSYHRIAENTPEMRAFS